MSIDIYSYGGSRFGTAVFGGPGTESLVLPTVSDPFSFGGAVFGGCVFGGPGSESLAPPTVSADPYCFSGSPFGLAVFGGPGATSAPRVIDPYCFGGAPFGLVNYGGSTSQAVTITLNPLKVTLPIGGWVQFWGLASTGGLTWSVSGPSSDLTCRSNGLYVNNNGAYSGISGTITNTGLFRATAGGLAIIYATSTTDPLIVQTACVNVLNYFEVDLLGYLNGLLGLPVYTGKIPQGKNPPAYTYMLIGEEPKYTLGGVAGLTAKTYQFSAFSTDYTETLAMESMLRQALNSYRGRFGSNYISSCRIENIMDMPYEKNVDGSDEGTFCRVAEYRIFVREAIPVC